MAKNFRELLKRIRIIPKNDKLYIQALTHRSYTNNKKEELGNYQRLEFLGDAVIELAISRYIYDLYGDMDEGSMSLLRSNLVRMETLALLAKDIELGNYIFLGLGEEKSNGAQRPSLLSDVYEALVAAIYLDTGYPVAEKFLFKQYEKLISKYGMEQFLELKDSKTKLQELVQADQKRSLEYVTLNVEGPANQPTFEIAVKMDGTVLGIGKGGSKKIAEQEAAKDALSKMATIKGD